MFYTAKVVGNAKSLSDQLQGAMNLDLMTLSMKTRWMHALPRRALAEPASKADRNSRRASSPRLNLLDYRPMFH
jgi:hypothetical protein